MFKRIAIIAVLILSATAFKCGSKPTDPPANAPCGVPMPNAFPVNVTSPGGVWVIADVPVPSEALTAIDEGIALQIERSSFYNPTWVNKRHLSDYKVMFVDPMATNVETDPGSPALIVHGIQTAGTVVGVGGDGCNVNFILIPHQAASNWTHIDYLKQTARNESEHDAEWANDPVIFRSFAISGDVHPHWP